jgi:hypothetical protein
MYMIVEMQCGETLGGGAGSISANGCGVSNLINLMFTGKLLLGDANKIIWPRL